MNLAPIAARLVDQASATFKLVGTAAEYAAAESNLLAAPAAFVLPARDRPQANAFMNQLVEQVVPTEFSVVLAVRCLTDATGGKAVDVLEPVRVAARNALLGWVPDGAEMGCEFAGGDLVTFANGVLVWVDYYRTQYTIRSV